MEANNKILNNQQITEEIKKEIKISIETNVNENTKPPNLWDSVKTLLNGRLNLLEAGDVLCVKLSLLPLASTPTQGNSSWLIP